MYINCRERGRNLYLSRVAPDGSDVCQLCHVCCGEEAGQAAWKALTRFSSWSSRLRNGCKQQQEQQSGHGITSGATSLAQLSSSLPHWNSPLPHLSSIHNTLISVACLPMRTHACTRSAPACFHALLRLCYGHKHRAQTSCGTCIHASNE